MDNDKLFEFMEKMYGEMQRGFKEVNNQISDLKNEHNELKAEVKELKAEVKKTNMVIENDVKPKIIALFDGYKQNTEQLNRIEKEVSRNEEVILRRIK